MAERSKASHSSCGLERGVSSNLTDTISFFWLRPGELSEGPSCGEGVDSGVLITYPDAAKISGKVFERIILLVVEFT
ncbi:hypothetical protein AX774_g3584 [Zancudomyces culisetae]|uniref:Uncharacterized protein n=1 Tax=Zancudomyces culisetae TaxID=1213189 RepID=A0A1R1PPL8_ZANCU|nr:hypothetical protein AX774_g3584 [Zancudomyces culisetae]|eukprot:OMH82925.1 hypothetical protein AX774_g3584 [Zancudomyces culisetae]